MKIFQNLSGFLSRSGSLSVLMSLATLAAMLFLNGCSAAVSSASVELADNLSKAVANNDDPATVEAGAPAYLLLVDSLIEKDPDNDDLLGVAASLYGEYAGVFVKDANRSRRLTDKSLGYAFRAACAYDSDICGLREADFKTFEERITEMDDDEDDVPVLYTLGAAWAGWIQAHREDMDAVAEISRVETIMKRTVELDEAYKHGEAHMYLGVISTFLPPALGGKPETGKIHFERAIRLAQGKNLMAKVLYAKHYARLLFERGLHDRLLSEVIGADPNVKGYVLVNTLAQQQARELLKSADDYF